MAEKDIYVYVPDAAARIADHYNQPVTRLENVFTLPTEDQYLAMLALAFSRALPPGSSYEPTMRRLTVKPQYADQIAAFFGLM
jgi:hypothetical protein